MTWQRHVVRTAARLTRRRVLDGVFGQPETARRYLVDPDWRRVEDGYAARLDARTTIDVAHPVGRWMQVDPLRPHDGWRSPWKAVGLGLWASALGIAWWVGSSRGRGPLALLHDREPGWASGSDGSDGDRW